MALRTAQGILIYYVNMDSSFFFFFFFFFCSCSCLHGTQWIQNYTRVCT